MTSSTVGSAVTAGSRPVTTAVRSGSWDRSGAGSPRPVAAGIWVDAAPFRAHLLFLAATCEVSWPVVAALAGVSQHGARSLVVGRAGKQVRRIHPGMAIRLLRVDSARLAVARRRSIGAVEARDRVLELNTAGWTPTTLARRVAMPGLSTGFKSLVDDPAEETPRCTELTAAAVSALLILCSGETPDRSATDPSSRLARIPVPTRALVAHRLNQPIAA